MVLCKFRQNVCSGRDFGAKDGHMNTDEQKHLSTSAFQWQTHCQVRRYILLMALNCLNWFNVFTSSPARSDIGSVSSYSKTVSSCWVMSRFSSGSRCNGSLQVFFWDLSHFQLVITSVTCVWAHVWLLPAIVTQQHHVWTFGLGGCQTVSCYCEKAEPSRHFSHLFFVWWPLVACEQLFFFFFTGWNGWRYFASKTMESKVLPEPRWGLFCGQRKVLWS